MEKKTIPVSKPAQGLLSGITGVFLGTAFIVLSLLFISYLGSHVIDQQFFLFDQAVFKLVYTIRSSQMTHVMLGITFFGSATFLIAALLLVIGYFIQQKAYTYAFIFTFLLSFGALLNLVLKNIFQRARPDFMPLVYEPSYSFPSGHSMNSMIFYTSLAFFIFYRMKNKLLGRILIGVSIVMILLIGISRIYLGAHYPTDVMAGFLAGLTWFLIVILFEKTIQHLNIFNTK